jgi:hypothetical protein
MSAWIASLKIGQGVALALQHKALSVFHPSKKITPTAGRMSIGKLFII